MLDIKKIIQDPAWVKQAMQERNFRADIDSILELDVWRRDIIKVVERQKALRNTVSEEIALLKKRNEPAEEKIAQMKQAGEEIKRLDEELARIDADLKQQLLGLPNIPDELVPKGKDERDNVEVRRIGVPRAFDFDPKPHWELGEQLGLFEAASAAKITGARFVVYKGLGARLERGLISFMLDSHIERKYTEILPPYMVNRDSMYGTGQLPKFEEDAFAVKNTNYFMAPTAEVPVTNLHRGEILAEESLPIRYCAYSACFRAEAGSAGRDTRGLIRLHQFNKVELVKFAKPEESTHAHEALTQDAELILRKLGLPYRVMVLCTGDLGFAAAKTYDIEVWMPSYNKYLEISSCSNYGDFQARRMNIKYRQPDGKTAFVHTLNGSGLAVGRTVAAIIENFQTEDGSVIVPEALIPYMREDMLTKR